MPIVSNDLQIYDLVCNDIAVRMIYGFAIQDDHKCRFHSIPCKTLVYFLSSTSNHSWMNTDWCREALEDNGYRKLTKKDNNKDRIEYTPYTTAIPGEASFTHLYVLRLAGDKWYVGLTTNLQNALDDHKAGKITTWTTDYPVVRVEETIAFDEKLPEHEAVVFVNKKVMELSKEYDFRHVKSSVWSD